MLAGGIECPGSTCYLTFVLLEVLMAQAERSTTVVSTKGQVILPKAVRVHRRWEAGTRLVVEETADGVLLREAPAFAATHPDDVFGVLRHGGAPKSIEEMDAAIVEEAKRRHAGA
jgi:AbrB family looped-hinge helix DNA binding protein